MPNVSRCPTKKVADGQAVCDAMLLPLEDRPWVVITRNGNYSAFNGYRFTPSGVSQVYCPLCGGVWRTAAAYVTMLPDGKF